MAHQERPLGFLEKLTYRFHQNFEGATNIAVMVKVEKRICPDSFQTAWKELYSRHPLLQATIHDAPLRFTFYNQFTNIPLKISTKEHFEEIEALYGRQLVKPFPLDQYLWRTQLVYLNGDSYVIFSAPHIICDARSIASLLAELMDTIELLKQGKQPEVTPYVLPLALDDELDRTRFSAVKVAPQLNQPISFNEYVPTEQSISNNILTRLKKSALLKLKEKSRQEQTTVNAALCSAFAKACAETFKQSKVNYDFSIAFDLRPYTKSRVGPSTLVFYAHQNLFQVPDVDNEFWSLARDFKAAYTDAIGCYQQPLGTDEQVLDAIFSGLNQAIHERHEFGGPPTVTNVGSLDEVFINHPAVTEFYFTIANRNLMPPILTAATINQTLCLNLNYTSPAVSSNQGEKIMKLIEDQLLAVAECFL